jgi:hypothetical protein
MKWTTETPTEWGFYWCKIARSRWQFEVPEPVFVTEDHDKSTIMVRLDTHNALPVDCGELWYGPIDPPEMP